MDEYEGFGSLTEMIKNQDKIATKEVEDKQKKDLIKEAKAKLTKALAKPVEDKEAEKKATSSGSLQNSHIYRFVRSSLKPPPVWSHVELHSRSHRV